MRIRRIVFLTIAALGLSAGVALATMGSGAVGSDPVRVVIESGTFTFYDGDDPDCDPQVFSAGDAFVDRGGGHVHIGRNESGAPVELSVTYLLPQGASPRTDAPDPGNCD